MFNTRLVREEDAHLYIETLTQLIQKFGPVKRPKVPSLLHKSDRLYHLAWTDIATRSVPTWAQDNFIAIKSECDMEDWPIEIHPFSSQNDSNTTIQDSFLDNRGHSVIFYDPDRCHEAGYFAGHMILKLAELRLSHVQSEYAQSPFMKRMAILSAACYNRQGFNLLNLTPYVSHYLTNTLDLKPIPLRLIENTLCFTSSLALKVRRQSSEQIIGTYGQLMPKACRKKILHAYKQIEAYDSDIKLMQIMEDSSAQSSGFGNHHAQQLQQLLG